MTHSWADLRQKFLYILQLELKKKKNSLKCFLTFIYKEARASLDVSLVVGEEKSSLLTERPFTKKSIVWSRVVFKQHASC